MSTTHVFLKSEPNLWTVGYYAPNGDWQPVEDFGSKEEARQAVKEYNGYRPPQPVLSFYENLLSGFDLSKIKPLVHKEQWEALEQGKKVYEVSASGIKSYFYAGFNPKLKNRAVMLVYSHSLASVTTQSLKSLSRKSIYLTDFTQATQLYASMVWDDLKSIFSIWLEIPEETIEVKTFTKTLLDSTYEEVQKQNATL